MNLNSGWVRETFSVIRKELRTEIRGKHGLYSSLLFAILTVSAFGIANANTTLEPSASAACLWIALLFSAIIGLARTFVTEEESRTMDLLRLCALPGPVFWGKLIFNLLLLIATALVTTPLFLLLLGVAILDLPLLLTAIACGCICLAASVSVCGALVARASGKTALAGVISIPVLLPALMLAIGATRVAFGEPGGSAWMAIVGLAGLAITFLSVGPYLFAGVWKQ